MTYKIEKGVPIPPRPLRGTKYPFAAMEVGDSFLLKDVKLSAASAAAGRAGRQLVRRFTVRTVPEGVRVWRTE